MKKVIVMFFMLIAITGCGNTSSFNIQNKKLNTEEINEIMSTKEYVIIDVRTKEEYDGGHLKDAVNIPYDTIDNTFDMYKEKIVFVYCRSGNRSSKAYNSLKELGYEVYDLGALDNISLPRE